MILSRVISLALRFAEFVCAAVVLGIDAHFLNIHHKYHTGSLGREIYVIVIAVLAIILALVWMLPTRSAMLHVPADIIIGLAWFAAFGVLVNYIKSQNCGGFFTWGNITHGSECDKWQAAEAFSFLSAIFWMASAIVGLWVYHKVERRGGVGHAGHNRGGVGHAGHNRAAV